jgi:hypothetical protein
MELERVYLFRQIGTDFVKIGMTKNSDVLERFRAFCTYAPQGAEIVGVIATNNALQLEKNLHNIYKDRRLNGEFFRLSENECLEIVKKYNDQKRNKAISLFFEIITNETFDIDLIISELKKQTKRKEIGFTEYHNLVKGFLEENKSDVWFTSTEIKEQIELKYDVKIDSMKIFGSELRKSIGEPKNKKLKGVVRAYYFIPKSLL